MRAGGLVGFAASLGRNDQCVNRFEVSRVLFRPQVFGGMEFCENLREWGDVLPNRAVSDLPWGTKMRKQCLPTDCCWHGMINASHSGVPAPKQQIVRRSYGRAQQCPASGKMTWGLA